jgi:hypothetical protein
VEWFAQEFLYRCSHWRASAYVGGPNPLTWEDIYHLPRRADLDADGYARLSYRQADTLWKCYTPDWDLHQLRHTAISLRAAHDYTEVDLKRFSGHSSLRSLERYIADNREAAKRKAREWERRKL